LAVDLCRIDGSIDSQVSGTFDGRLVAVPQKYGYLETVMFSVRSFVQEIPHPVSPEFRAQTSFLVTERCNNYCLMCSQPPKMWMTVDS